MSLAEKQGHSATVDLQLHVNGRVLSLSEVGPDFCVLSKEAEITVGSAEIVVVIDEQVQRRVVELLPPVPHDDRRIPLRPIDH